MIQTKSFTFVVIHFHSHGFFSSLFYVVSLNGVVFLFSLSVCLFLNQKTVQIGDKVMDDDEDEDFLIVCQLFATLFFDPTLILEGVFGREGLVGA